MSIKILIKESEFKTHKMCDPSSDDEINTEPEEEMIKIKIAKNNNCGCGQDPCITFGPPETKKQTINLKEQVILNKGNINIMKITKEKLKSIIREEIDTSISRIFTRRQLTESESKQAILVQLSTSWCPPCKEIKKMFTLAGVSAKQWIYVDLDSQSQINQNRKYIKMIEKLQGPIKSIPILLLLTPENPKGVILKNNIFLNMSGDQEKLKQWMTMNKISLDSSMPDPIELSDDPANPGNIKK